jgi:dipeptidyl aminopeptidase/acylaminoacyl peptidase
VRSASTLSFAASYAFFLLSNYAMVLVNYRGSTGQGEATLLSLQGNVGENDVADWPLGVINPTTR